MPVVPLVYSPNVLSLCLLVLVQTHTTIYETEDFTIIAHSDHLKPVYIVVFWISEVTGGEKTFGRPDQTIVFVVTDGRGIIT